MTYIPTEPVEQDEPVVDLHGYSVREAEDIAGAKIAEAWRSGCSYITLIHGSPLIRHHMIAQMMQRGGIKWRLRGMLARGDWNRYVYPRRSRKHYISDGSMTLRLRPYQPE